MHTKPFYHITTSDEEWDHDDLVQEIFEMHIGEAVDRPTISRLINAVGQVRALKIAEEIGNLDSNDECRAIVKAAIKSAKPMR